MTDEVKELEKRIKHLESIVEQMYEVVDALPMHISGLDAKFLNLINEAELPVKERKERSQAW